MSANAARASAFATVIVLIALALYFPLKAAAPASLLDILSAELQRNFVALKEKADPPPYYMSYTVTDDESQLISGSLGAIAGETNHHLRYLDTTVRVGAPQLDNYHVVKGDRGHFTSGAVIPLDNVSGAIDQRLWLETDRTYR